MKKTVLFSLLLVTVTTFGSDVEFAPYDSSYKEDVFEIMFQDKRDLFLNEGGYGGIIPEWLMDIMNKKEVEPKFENDLVHTKVLLDEKRPAAVVMYYRTRAQSLESLKRVYDKRGRLIQWLFPFNEEKIRTYMPDLKETDAECSYYVLLEILAVSRDFRRKGYGSACIKQVIEGAKSQWPDIKTIKLNVNTTNDAARRLYESEGFVKNEQQSATATMMNYVEYERTL